MTVRFLKAWNGFSEQQIVSSLTTQEETRLIGLGFCTTDLYGTGGLPVRSSSVANSLSDSQKSNQAIAGLGGVGGGIVFDENGKPIGPVSIVGVFEFGQTVSAVLAPGYSATSFQWRRKPAGEEDFEDIVGATNITYTQVSADIDAELTVDVIGLRYSALNSEVSTYNGPPLLRVASPYNRSATEVVSASGAVVEVALRLFRPIGSANKRKLSVRLDNWYYASATNIAPGAPITFPYGLGIEINGVTVPLRINGQPLTNYTLAAGAFNIKADLLEASEFGLTRFTRGLSGRVRGVQRGTSIPVAGAVDLQDVCRSYDPTQTTCTNPLGTGALTFTGTNPTSTTVPFITLIGEDEDSAADARCWAANGDSIPWQSEPQSYFMKALEGNNTASGLISGIVLGRAGGTNIVVNNHPNEIGSFAELVNGIADNYGTNDIPGTANATIVTRARSNYSIFRARASTHPLARDLFIMRMPLLMKTTGTFATLAGQTITSSWNAGQNAEQLDDLMRAQEGIAGGHDLYAENLTLSPNLMRGSASGKGTTGSDYYKFAPNTTVDGTHPNGTGASGTTGLGANARVYMLANA